MRIVVFLAQGCAVGYGMRIAILADAKANEPALLAVLAAVDRLHVERIWHIGSLLGYGPDPLAVAERIHQVTQGTYCLSSPHDSAIISVESLSLYGPSFLKATLWTRRQLQPSWLAGGTARARIAWLHGLSAHGADGALQLFSTTPVDFIYGVLQISAGREDELRRQLDAVPGCALVGALGRPGIVWRDDAVWHAVMAEQSSDTGGRRCIACPGAVGQPRDRDPRASFLLWEDGRLTWQRVEYDVAETQRRIRCHPDLAPHYAERLAIGV